MNLQILTVAIVVWALCSGPRVSAQEPQREQPRPANASPTKPPEERPSRYQATNVRIELTVTDSVGPSGPQKKSISMMIADGHMGRIRALRGGGGEPMLNVDATPIITGERVRLQVSLEYVAPSIGASGTRLASITEVVTVLVEPGKPMVISQSADPAVDRKVTVEVTATILK
jgi:hypothetical protein